VAAVTVHRVALPYPDRDEPTVGRCDCGWSVVYRWGEHGDGQDAAIRHVIDDSLTKAVVLEQFDGTRFVVSGETL
jgi:hypothetical protein